MTPEHTALVARVREAFTYGGTCDFDTLDAHPEIAELENWRDVAAARDCLAALCALAGELEESEQSRDFNHAAAKAALDQRDWLRKDAEYVRKAIAEISRESILGAAFAGDSEHEWYDKGWTACVRALKRLLPLHCYVDPSPIDAALADKPRLTDGCGNDITHLAGEKL